MTPLELALDLAALGLPVHPLKPRDKRPTLSAWPDRASVDPQAVEEMFAGHTGNVGIATGHPLPSGGYLVVIDVDEHDPAASGSEALDELSAQHGALPDTMVVYTPSDGRHLYYSTPEPLTNGAGSHLPAGIDIRGLGGYVVAADSELDAGRYELDVEEHPIAALPAAWLRLLDPPRQPTAPAPRPTSSTWADAPRPSSDSPGDAYAAANTWHDILPADGWTYAGRGGSGEDQWTRPGKTVREGTSATTGYGGTYDLLKVFTPNAGPLVEEETYSKLGYYATMHHAGDYEAAAEALRALGYGTPPSTSTSSSSPAEVLYEAAAPDEAWSPVVPLGDSVDLPIFPVDTLPAWLAAQVAQTAEEMQLDPDLAAQLGIAALAIVTGGRVYITINGAWRESTNLYTVTALPPSAGKSPTYKFMLRPITAWEARLREEGAKEAADQEIRRKVLEKERDNLINKGETAQALAKQDELNKTPAITPPRVMADDITPEKLTELLSQQGGRLAVASTEGGLFGMMVGRYSDKANLDVYLNGWSGDSITRDRVGGGTQHVEAAHLTVALTVQPDVIASLADTPELAGRGLTARFMYSHPRDTVGTRNKRRRSNYRQDVAEAYKAHLDGLIDMLAGQTTPLELTLSDAALDLYLDWQQAHEDQLGPMGELRHMAEWIAKCESSTARLAAMLHLADDRSDRSPISADVMARAIRVGDYWTAHARKAHDMMGADELVENARRLLDWIKAKQLDEVSVSELHVGNRRRFTKVADIVPAVELLAERNHIRALFDGPLVVGRRGMESPRFAIHPVHNRAERTEHLTDSASPTAESRGDMYHSRHLLRDDLETSLSPNTSTNEDPPETRAERTQPPEHADAGLLAIVDGIAGPVPDHGPF